MSSKTAVSATNLGKDFGSFTAVHPLSFSIRPGEVFGFLGPNGSGKSTTIRMLCGILRPSQGSALVLGHPLGHGNAIKASLGYMSQKFSLYDDLTIKENLEFFRRVYGVDSATWAGRYPKLLALAQLTGREDDRVGHIPGGWRQRLALATALVHQPPLLFLDEATSGVDPEARQSFWDTLYTLAADGMTIIVTTHYMDEAEHCNRILFLKEGRRLGYGTPEALKAAAGCRTMEDVFVRLAAGEGVKP